MGNATLTGAGWLVDEISGGVAQLSADGTSLVSGDGTSFTFPDVAHGRTLLVTAAELAATPSILQTKHDALKAAGGGHIVLEAGATYTPTQTVTFDTSYCGLRFNGAKVDISGIGSGNFWLTLDATLLTSSDTQAVNREFSGGWITGNFVAGAGNSSGVSAFRFNCTTSGASNRVVSRNMRIGKCWRAVSYLNRSYFVRWYDSYFYRNGRALYQEAAPTDFAELDSFINCVIAENDIHLEDAGGNIWKFAYCSFDYHLSRLMNLTQGATCYLTDCHLEWNYGASGGETNTPIALADANTSLYARGGCWSYTGAGQNPNYTSTVSVNNGANIVDIDLDKASKLGRLTDTTGLDALCFSSTFVDPTIRVKLRSQGGLVSDLPAMTFYADSGANTGIAGTLRNGVDNILNEVSHRAALTGTCALTHVTATENGVSLRNGASMLKITGIGKVILSFPVLEFRRRHAWSFFTNPAFVTGSVTIKERQTGYGQKFDGTTVTNVADVRGAAYSPTTVTVSAGSNAWTRRSWKDCNTVSLPSRRQDIATIVQIEIDTASMSAGALYLSHLAFDTI